jgi:hypothetical protein
MTAAENLKLVCKIKKFTYNKIEEKLELGFARTKKQ